MRKHKTQAGFGAILAIVVLVILAALAAAIVKFGTTQALTSAQDIESARAWQAAKAGTEWGLFQALQAGGIWQTTAQCNGTSQTLDLSAATGFRVTVTCQAADFNEGQQLAGITLSPLAVRTYTITAVACNSTVCPDSTAAVTSGYVERMREVVAFCPVVGGIASCT